MSLSSYLLRAGVITGPLSKNTSHSSLEIIKKHLLGQEQFKGGEQYLIFGNVLHNRFASIEVDVTPLNDDEKKRIEIMTTKLNSHPVVKKLTEKCIREEKIYVHIEGVEVALILDVKQLHLFTGADLKTTNCRSLTEFIEKAKEYGYFRQAQTYMIGAKLKNFFFIGIQKFPPFNIYIFDVKGFKEEMAYALEELKFLLYFFKHYGKIITGEMPKVEAQNPKIKNHDKKERSKQRRNNSSVAKTSKTDSSKVAKARRQNKKQRGL